VAVGGLLIDTLVYRFFEQTHEFDAVGSGSFDRMARDFFEFLKNEPEKDYYLALGSRQRVYVKDKFQSKAKKAYNRCVEAMEAEGTFSANDTWREVFGTSVPRAKKSSNVWSFRNTEEFVEDRYLVEISETVSIDCEVTQNGWRLNLVPLRSSRRMDTCLTSISTFKSWTTGLRKKKQISVSMVICMCQVLGWKERLFF